MRNNSGSRINNVAYTVNRVIAINIQSAVAILRTRACFAQALFSPDEADNVLGLGDHLILCQADFRICGIKKVIIIICRIIYKTNGKIHDISAVDIAHIDIGASVDIVGEYVALMIS